MKDNHLLAVQRIFCENLKDLIMIEDPDRIGGIRILGEMTMWDDTSTVSSVLQYCIVRGRPLSFLLHSLPLSLKFDTTYLCSFYQ
jgi:hypothetical protein